MTEIIIKYQFVVEIGFIMEKLVGLYKEMCVIFMFCYKDGNSNIFNGICKFFKNLL